MKKSRIVVIVVLAVLFCAVLVWLITGASKPKSGTVSIKGLDKCSVNIHETVQNDIMAKTYDLVKTANDYNKQQTLASYKAQVREGSCNQKQTRKTTNPAIEGGTIKTSSIIVDIPDAKQSWTLSYDWVTKGSQIKDIDLGTITPECLPKDKLLYGDFKCENIISLMKYGTDRPDPILQYIPYTGAGFNLDYNPDNKTVTVLILPPPDTKDIAAFTENTKAVIPYWFQKRGLDQSKYTIIFNSDSEAGENEEN